MWRHIRGQLGSMVHEGLCAGEGLGSRPGPGDHASFPVTHPEVEPVPGLFLRVDAVGFGPADGPDVGLMALFEVDELEGGGA